MWSPSSNTTGLSGIIFAQPNNGNTSTCSYAEGTGIWNDCNAKQYLTGLCFVWIDINPCSKNVPYLLKSFNLNLYPVTNPYKSYKPKYNSCNPSYTPYNACNPSYTPYNPCNPSYTSYNPCYTPCPTPYPTPCATSCYPNTCLIKQTIKSKNACSSPGLFGPTYQILWVNGGKIPDGISINSSTGVLNFHKVKRGIYKIKIINGIPSTPSSYCGGAYTWVAYNISNFYLKSKYKCEKKKKCKSSSSSSSSSCSSSSSSSSCKPCKPCKPYKYKYKKH